MVGRSVGVRSCFFEWVVYHIFLPMVFRCARFTHARAPISSFLVRRLYLINLLL